VLDGRGVQADGNAFILGGLPEWAIGGGKDRKNLDLFDKGFLVGIGEQEKRGVKE